MITPQFLMFTNLQKIPFILFANVEFIYLLEPLQKGFNLSENKIGWDNGCQKALTKS